VFSTVVLIGCACPAITVATACAWANNVIERQSSVLLQKEKIKAKQDDQQVQTCAAYCVLKIPSCVAVVYALIARLTGLGPRELDKAFGFFCVRALVLYGKKIDSFAIERETGGLQKGKKMGGGVSR